MASADGLLSAATQKLIGDPRYEKRKAAALEVEQVVKRLAASQDHARVRALADRLIAEFAFSPQANHRKGALLCLAAAAVGLSDAPGAEQHLRQIVPPILASFTDQDARVRYYACEALYNVGKSSRGGGFVEFFPEVFDATFRLCADPEPNVQSAVQFLDSLVKVRGADEGVGGAGRDGGWRGWRGSEVGFRALVLFGDRASAACDLIKPPKPTTGPPAPQTKPNPGHRHGVALVPRRRLRPQAARIPQGPQPVQAPVPDQLGRRARLSA